jgi:hypothetical protein
MQYYLYGSALSTRKNDYTPVARELRLESERLALIQRAYVLHGSSPTGLCLDAARLKPKASICHLRSARGGRLIILVWITLSDGSRHRASWLRENDEGRLCERWNRIPWASVVFATRTPHKATQHAS